jgi:ketosteroid isomerase-like protein
MTNNIDTVKQMNKAFETKNVEAARALLHPNYSFKGPMMEMHGAEDVLQMMQSCPFSCVNENVSFVAQGDKVVQTLDWVSSAPVKFRLRMCSIVTVENGKVRSEELFYDSAKFPPEAVELMQKAMQGKKAA